MYTRVCVHIVGLSSWIYSCTCTTIWVQISWGIDFCVFRGRLCNHKILLMLVMPKWQPSQKDKSWVSWRDGTSLFLSSSWHRKTRLGSKWPVINTRTPIINTYTLIINTRTPIINTHTLIINTYTPIINTHTIQLAQENETWIQMACYQCMYCPLMMGYSIL